MSKVHVLSWDGQPYRTFSSRKRALASMVKIASLAGFKVGTDSLRLDFGTHMVDCDGRSTGLTLHTMDVE